MKKIGVFVCLLAVVSFSTIAFADGFRRIREFLDGSEEVPAVSTVADGKFRARISEDQTQIDWRLSYEDLESDVRQAHIHFGQKGVNGGIVVFLCTNLGNGPVGTQLCPPSPATISGTITAADIGAGAQAQGLAAGEFDEFLKAIRDGLTYANVHTANRPGGEIRSQIDGKHEHDDGHDHDHHSDDH